MGGSPETPPAPAPAGQRAAEEFIDYVETAKQRGIDGSGEEAFFVPMDALLGYWDLRNITRILAAASDLPRLVGVGDIYPRYLRLFSLLAYNGLLDLLEEFTRHGIWDEFFPLSGFPAQWPDDSEIHRLLFGIVRKKQWMFFPLIITPGAVTDRQLPVRQVLPFMNREVIRVSDAIVVGRVQVPRSCQEFCQTPPHADEEADEAPSYVEFIVKCFTDEGASSAYRHELQAMTSVMDLGLDFMMSCRASFVQDDTCNIVYEVANRGSLREYLCSIGRPTSIEEFSALAVSVACVLLGVHNFYLGHSLGFKPLAGFQPSVRLDNVQVDSYNPEYPHNFVPRVSDFSNGLVRLAPTETEPWETTHAEHDERPAAESGTDTVATRADVWAFGIVLSQAVAWAALGTEALFTYPDSARTAGGRVTGLQDGGLSGAERMLDDIRAIHRRAVAKKTEFSAILASVVEIIENDMLVCSRDWVNTGDLYNKILAVIPPQPDPETGEGYERGDESDVDGIRVDEIHLGYDRNDGHDDGGGSSRDADSADDGESETTRDSTSLGRNGRKPGRDDAAVTLADVEAWRRARIAGRPQKTNVDVGLWKLHTQLRDRRYVFLLDDAPSVRSSQVPDMRSTLVTLADMASHVTGRPSELLLASDATLRGKRIGTSEKEISRIVSGLSKNGIPSLADVWLARLVDHVIVPHLLETTQPTRSRLGKKRPPACQPITVFVITEGNWEKSRVSSTDELMRPLMRLLETILRKRLDPNLVLVQFLELEDTGEEARDPDSDFARDAVDRRILLEVLSGSFGRESGPRFTDKQIIRPDTGITDIFLGCLGLEHL